MGATTRRIATALLALLPGAAAAPAATTPAGGDAPAAVTAIRAGRLLDPADGSVRKDAVVVVEGGRIRDAGSRVAVPEGATVIDLGGATLLPGLFDCHTHLCVATRKPSAETPRAFYEAVLTAIAVDTTGYRAIQGAAHAREMLEAGFTTVRDLGNAASYADTDVRRAIEEGAIPGPTIVNAGRIITPTGGQFPPRLPPFFAELFGPSSDFIGVLSPERPGLASPEYLFADTADELRKAVREVALHGARVIKVVVDDQPFAYSAADLRVVVEEAGRAGLKVAAHCLTDAGARAAAEAGVASIEHGFLLSDETLALMKRNGVTLVGTDFTAEAGRAIGLPEELHARVVERLRRAHRAGVTLAFGSDLFFSLPGLTRGQAALTYLESSIEAGLPPRAILEQLVPNAARLLGVDGERGAVRPGLAADLVAVRGDPLADPRELQRVFFVMKDGRVVRHDRGEAPRKEAPAAPRAR